MKPYYLFYNMPFTAAHAAIVLPFLKKKHFSATALLAGSVAPDFEYFFKLSVDGVHGHTLPGLFYFNIPVVVLLSFLFHTIVKQNLLLNLPGFLQERFQDTLHFNFIDYIKAHPVVFLFSALLGASSHLLWDSFTHGDGYFASTLWFYENNSVFINGARYPLFYVLQHVSTVLGLGIVIVYILFKVPVKSEHKENVSVSYWVVLTLITSVVVAIRFLIKHDDVNAGNIVVSIISGLCVAVLICGLIPFRKFHKEADRLS